MAKRDKKSEKYWKAYIKKHNLSLVDFMMKVYRDDWYNADGSAK